MTRYFLLLTGLLLHLISCTDEEVCLIPNTTQLKITTKVKQENLWKDSLLTNARLYFGNTPMYQYSIRNSQYSSLLLNPQEDITRFYFQADSSDFSPTGIDTCTLQYTRQLKFISKACGYYTEFTIQNLSYTTHTIDSIWITNPLVNQNINTNHLQLALKQ